MNTTCRICGKEHSLKLKFIKWGYPVYYCGSCGTGITQIEDTSRIQEIYDETYFQGGQKDGYADYSGSEKILRKEFGRIVQRITKFSSAGNKLLEIGSAYGFFLLEAEKYFTCTGIEIAESAANYAKSRHLNVYNQLPEKDLLNKIGPVNIVVLLDVIEHLPDPLKTIRLVSEIISENGIIVLTTGNFNSLYSRIAGKKWRLMTPPQHLFFFTFKGLKQLLMQTGFKIVLVRKPAKLVPLKLILYQLTKRLGFKGNWINRIYDLGIPVNLWDTFFIVARKEKLEKVNPEYPNV
ncbi:MAG: class I SAM-dependent methyltransferase [Bacteroidales bacterium]|nr:class I SAM-dependent methyltransferase [Bacteroidales bacterium]